VCLSLQQCGEHVPGQIHNLLHVASCCFMCSVPVSADLAAASSSSRTQPFLLGSSSSSSSSHGLQQQPSECQHCGTYCEWDDESEWEDKWMDWESKLAYYDRTYGELFNEWWVPGVLGVWVGGGCRGCGWGGGVGGAGLMGAAGRGWLAVHASACVSAHMTIACLRGRVCA
jgi:hypothetical protein